MIKVGDAIIWAFNLDDPASIKQGIAINNEQQVMETILHEIAHALVPHDGHGLLWRRQARAIGCTAVRCYSDEVVEPKGKLRATCQCAGKSHNRHKAPKRLRRCVVCKARLVWVR